MTYGVENQAHLDVVLSLRRAWGTKVYPALRSEFDALENVASNEGPYGIAKRVHGLPLYPWFAWMERGTQKMLWRAVQDAVGHDGLPDTPKAPHVARLELDPDLIAPDWYLDWDIHLQPGGVARDALSARVYELGAKLVMMGENDDYRFHQLFTTTAAPARAYKRIVDLGCGFGKSTWPWRQHFADAEVIGIDLSAPCLALAAEKADRLNLPITFRQAEATATGLADQSADLVTATMLVHEIPIDHLPKLMAEISRLLAPGGRVLILDFQPTGDAFRDLAMIEHGARNNEPFLPAMMAADWPAIADQAGLVDAKWTAFDERGPGLLDQAVWPTRSEWHFPWAVFSAEKPA
jgi:ubiquinone/menaquinone biosynthesis C-methylase UbiE